MSDTFPTVADYLTHCVKGKYPVCFLKFGDGEYQCVRGFRGRNCDGDPYNSQLAGGIVESFRYLTQFSSVVIGAWHTKEVLNFWQSLVPSRPINWVNYHTIIVDKTDIEDKTTGELNKKMQLFEAIRDSPMRKIIVCNELLQKAEILFNADKTIFIPLRDWFQTQRNHVIQKIADQCRMSDKSIIIFAAGMSSKVLIYELYKQFPQNIYLDFGSALDLLCTKHDSRGRGYSYETLYENIKSVLPEEKLWNAPEYNQIYKNAREHLGIHLRGR